MKFNKLLIPASLIALGTTALPMVAMTGCSNTLTINGKDNLIVGEETDYTTNVKGNIFWNIGSGNSDCAVINDQGHLVAIKTGTFTLYASYLNDKNVMTYASKQINIKAGENKTIPISLLDIDDRNVLKGFKVGGLDLSEFNTLMIPKNVKSIADNAFFGALPSGRLASLLPNNIVNLVFEPSEDGGCETIGEMAFYMSPFITIQLTEGIKRIEFRAFAFSSKLSICNFPVGLNYVGDESFMETNLTAVIFNEKRVNIGEIVPNYPWMRQDEGDAVDGSYVEYIGKRAFFNCQRLRYIRGTSYLRACEYLKDSAEDDFKDSPFACINKDGITIGESRATIIDLCNLHLEESRDGLDPNLTKIYAKKCGEHFSGETFTFRIRDLFYRIGNKDKMKTVVSRIAQCFAYSCSEERPTQFIDGVYVDWQSNYYGFMLNYEQGSYHENPDKTYGNDEWASFNIVPTDMVGKLYPGKVDVKLLEGAPVELIDSDHNLKRLYLAANKIKANTEAEMRAVKITIKVQLTFVNMVGEESYVTDPKTIELTFGA